MGGLLLLTFAGCAPFGVLGHDDVVVIDGEDRIGVLADVLEFGTVSASAGLPGEQLLRIENLGDTEVAVYVDGTDLADTAFFLLSDSRIFSLGVGESKDVPVYFAPTTDGEATAELILQPGNLKVKLDAVGTAPVATVYALDVGNVVIGCSAERSLVVTNTGTEPLTVNGASTTSTGFTVDSTALSLDAGESGEVRLEFTPSAAVAYAGEVVLLTNDPERPRMSVAVSGTGDDGEKATEQFEHTLRSPTDILMLVDNAASMSLFLDRGAAAAESFVDVLRDGDADFHFAALALDGECPNGNISFATPDDSGSATESMMKSAFKADYSGASDDLLPLARNVMDGDISCLSDFRREEADFHIIGVTDGPNEADFTDNLAALDDLVLPPYAISVSAMTPTEVCGGRAWDWADAAVASDGEVRDACAASWDASFEAFAGLISKVTAVSFYLTGRPVVSTIEVRIEGVTSTSWTYDESANAIVFPADKRPPRGATIDVLYVEEGTCSAE